MEEASPLFSGDKIADILQISEEVSCLLLNQLKKRKIRTCVISESSAGNLKITLEYYLKANEKLTKFKHDKFLEGTLGKTQKHKRKSPSRQRRDRERLRSFLERKKSKSNDNIRPVQCSPPVEISVTVPDPPTVTLPSQPPSTAPRTPVVDFPVESITKYNSYACVCEICKRFNVCDTDPISLQHKECGNCGKPGTLMEPLKPCSRCIICAYCSKKCQTVAWPKHKASCSKKTGDEAKELREKWREAREIWLNHAFEPLLPPTS